ncbi:MAG: Zn-ribbon domain-containing OB-fold protein [Burkholderiaceae bacterium]
MNTAPAPLVFQDPVQNPENKLFWDSAQQGKLLLKHCTACDTTHYYPRPYCPHCGSEHTEWQTSSGIGEVYSFTRMVRGVQTPYLMAYIRLDDGVTVLSHLQADDWDAVQIGMRVKVNFVPSASGQNVPVFVPDLSATT